MFAFDILNEVTGEKSMMFGYSERDARERYPEYASQDWVITLAVYED